MYSSEFKNEQLDPPVLMAYLNGYYKKQPSSVVLIESAGELTWQQLYELSIQYSRSLEAFTKAKVVLHLSQSINNVALLIAADMLAITAILVPAYYSEEKALSFADRCSAAAIVSWRNGQLNIQQCCVNSSRTDTDDTPLICILTSGTTGEPKIVEHSWSSLKTSINLHSRYAEETWFLGYPLTHYAGLQVFLQAFLNGAKLVIPSDTTPSAGASFIFKGLVTHLNVTPTYFRQMMLGRVNVDINTQAVKHITFGGEIADQAVLDLARKTFPSSHISHIYASTELGVLLRVTDGLQGFDKCLVELGGNLKIINDELYAKTNRGAMKRYFNETNSPSEEWVATGDLVTVEGDRIFFSGRKTEVINIGGFKVCPQYVENVVNQIDGVEFSMISAKKSSVVGNLIKLTAVLGKDKDESIMKIKIVDHCRKQLPYFMVPRLFEFVASVPVTYTNKLKRG